MFSCSFNNESEMKQSVRNLNTVLVKKGLRVLPLRFQNNRALIYVYRPSKLSKDLQQNNACCLLKKFGYTTVKPERCIVQLMQRLIESEEFPHEIGLFLGYPPEDVSGFIENKAGKCKCGCACLIML